MKKLLIIFTFLSSLYADSKLEITHIDHCYASYDSPFSYRITKRFTSRLSKDGSATEWYAAVQSIDLPSIDKHLINRDDDGAFTPVFSQTYWKDDSKYEDRLRAYLFINWDDYGRLMIEFIRSKNKQVIINTTNQDDYRRLMNEFMRPENKQVIINTHQTEVYTNITFKNDGFQLISNCNKKLKQQKTEFILIDLAIVIFSIGFLILIIFIFKRLKNKFKKQKE